LTQEKRAMKSTFSLLLIGLCVLLAALACQNNLEPVFPVDEVAPPVTTKPVTSTAPALPVTNVAALTAITPPPLTRFNCRIVKTIHKQGGVFTGPDPNPEVIIALGDTITAYRVVTTFYKYDEQGRISRITEGPPNTDFFKTFSYDKGAVYTERLTTMEGKGKFVEKDTILLNEQGLKKYKISKAFGVERLYDSDGYFIGHKGESRPTVLVENRNLTKDWAYFSDGQIISGVYEYDLNRPGLPNPLTYLGRSYPAVNQETKFTLYAQNSSDYRDGVLYTLHNYYKYDQYGRVSCWIRYSQYERGSNYYLGQYIGGLGITYYEYECP
jgi:hypothetical protein